MSTWPLSFVCRACFKTGSGIMSENICGGCGVSFVGLKPSTRFHSDACYTKYKRSRQKGRDPNKTTRTFTCKDCHCEWETAEAGRFHRCPTCSNTYKNRKRQKTCVYCASPFEDLTRQNGKKYCSDICVYKAKVKAAGLVPEKGFLFDRVEVCIRCQTKYTPTVGTQLYCSIPCQEKDYSEQKSLKRNKICVHCELPFQDDSLKGNRRAHDACSRKTWGIRVDAERPLMQSDRLASHRRSYLWSGGGTFDDIRTMKKFTATWWGRVAELMYAAYRPEAEDVVVTCGNKSPFDFRDATFGRVDVKGMLSVLSPFGLPTWKFDVSGLHLSCDTVFVVGFSPDKTSVERLWLMPSK